MDAACALGSGAAGGGGRSAAHRPRAQRRSRPGAGEGHLPPPGVGPLGLLDDLPHFGFSSICNTLAAIKTAKLLDLGPDDAVITVATDGSALYPSERAKLLATRFGGEPAFVLSRDHLISNKKASGRLQDLADVEWLAADERQGRGVGTAGLAATRDRIAARTFLPAHEVVMRCHHNMTSNEMLRQAGFVSVDKHDLPHDVQNNYYVARID